MDDIIVSLGNTSDACFAVDAYQRIILWNAAAGGLLHLRAEDALGRYCYRALSLADHYGDSYCRHQCPSRRLARRGRLVPSRRVVAQTADGACVTLDVMTIVVPDGEGAPYLIHYMRRAEGAAAPTPKLPSAVRTHEVALACLTPREFEVLALLAEGATTADVAARLTIAQATARNHIQHIIDKLHAHSRLEAVAVARRSGILAAS